MPVGLDDMAFYTPKLYLDIQELAEKRQIPAEKLQKGLGLYKMGLPDVHEDAATMAAEVVAELITRNNLDPRRIGRIYMGTESALDLAKPTATYAVGMVEERLAGRYGAGCLRHCDVLDMTFACIGATDALHNTLDWVASDEENIAIVIASDIAKYELESTGEYTQGAGAVAMLVKWHPRLLVVRRLFGVAMESVHDFFKPRLEQYSDTPVFDGPYSNVCYQNRMKEALADFRRRAVKTGVFGETEYRDLSSRWARMIFHQPYAYHAKRMFVESFVEGRKASGKWTEDLAEYDFQEPVKTNFSDDAAWEKAQATFLKAVSTSALYQHFIREKLEKSQRASSETGNLYTASIFLALMSTLEFDLSDGSDLSGAIFGFIAYGSGSKAKVFEAVVQPEWTTVAAQFRIFEKLDQRQAVNYQQYEALHTGAQETPLYVEPGRYGLTRIGTEGVTLGARYYAAQQ
ncbi:MAG: hydroxymethylglutaryl-CoA synthase family protein [Bacteroidetes bacterium]|nr:MAG: hydroxymethylglutaryl-CoA synthase family protein [Bacteroidota bacterium]